MSGPQNFKMHFPSCMSQSCRHARLAKPRDKTMKTISTPLAQVNLATCLGTITPQQAIANVAFEKLRSSQIHQEI